MEKRNGEQAETTLTATSSASNGHAAAAMAKEGEAKPGAYRASGGPLEGKQRRSGPPATRPGAYRADSSRSLGEEAKAKVRADIQSAMVRSRSAKNLVERPEQAQVTAPTTPTVKSSNGIRSFGSSPSLRLGAFRANNRANKAKAMTNWSQSPQSKKAPAVLSTSMDDSSATQSSFPPRNSYPSSKNNGSMKTEVEKYLQANMPTTISTSMKPGAVPASGGTQEGKPARTPRGAEVVPGAAARSRSVPRGEEGKRASGGHRAFAMAMKRSASTKSMAEWKEDAMANSAAAAAPVAAAAVKPGAVQASGGIREGKAPRSPLGAASGANAMDLDMKPGAVPATGGPREGKSPRSPRPAVAGIDTTNMDVKPGAVQATGGSREGKAPRSPGNAAVRPGAVRSRSPVPRGKGTTRPSSRSPETPQHSPMSTRGVAEMEERAIITAPTSIGDTKPGAVSSTGGSRNGKSSGPARAPSPSAAAARPGAVSAFGGNRNGKSSGPARAPSPSAPDSRLGAVSATGGNRSGKSSGPARAPSPSPAAAAAPATTTEAARPGAVSSLGGSRHGKDRAAASAPSAAAGEARPGAVSASGGARIIKSSGPTRASAPGAVRELSAAPQGKPNRGGAAVVLTNGRSLEDQEEEAQITTKVSEHQKQPAQVKRSGSNRSLFGDDEEQGSVSRHSRSKVKRAGSDRSLLSGCSITLSDKSEEAEVTVPNPPETVLDTSVPGAISEVISEDSMYISKSGKDHMNDSSKAGTYAQLPMPDGTTRDHTKAKSGTYAQIPEEESAPFLIEAQLVDESARISVYVAEEAEPVEEADPKRARRIAMGVLCFVVVAVAVVLSVVLTYDFGTEVTYSWEEDDTDYELLKEECLANITAEECEANCAGIHGVDLYLGDKCCAYAGRSASILAFEEDSLWEPRLEEFFKCTGASIRLEYLPEGEDGMAAALRNDLGDDVSHDQGNAAGQGLFDAYIVQAPWLWPVVNGLENLTPRIRENADTVKFLDINPASRSAVSYNGTVRALPLDTDYIALGWRQDVFYKYNVAPELSPPRTIQDLATLAEQLNGLDFNEDGEPDWGICLTPQVNYFYAFVAPMMQSSLRDPVDGTPTGQNMFFSTDAFEPLIHQPAFKTAVEVYYKIIRNSNCAEQLSKGEKCDRKTAFPTGRCAMVISMPGTLTKMLLDGAKYAPVPRTNETSGEVQWDINNMPLGTGGSYWGRRAAFPGSTVVQDWDADAGYPLVECTAEEGEVCPLADENGINFAPFFAEGGEAYAINGRQSSPAAKTVMWDFFTWLAELPESELPLSGQYRLSHLNEEHREELTEQAGWPNQMVDDIFNVLGQYFKSEENGGNPVQDLLMLGFPEYMGALDEELHETFLGVKTDSTDGVFNWNSPQESIDPSSNSREFNNAFDDFIESLETRYSAISASISGGRMGQLQRWRSSLNLPWRTEEELCVSVLSSNKTEAFNGLQCSFYVSFESLCQTEPDAVANLDKSLCESFKSGPNIGAVVAGIIIPLMLLAVLGGYIYGQMKKREAESRWQIQLKDLDFDEPPEVIGNGRFGEVVLATYRGSRVAVKTCKIAPEEKPKQKAEDDDKGLPPIDEAAPGGDEEAPDDVSDVSFPDGQAEGKPDASTSSSTARKSNPMSSFGSLGLKSMTKSIMNSKNSRSPREKFIREIRLLTNLQEHRNIVCVMGAVISGTKVPKLVLEYMENGSLCDYLRSDGKLSGKLILNIIRDVAQGLLFLHSSNPTVLHSDLKSSNILIDDRFRAKVSDFGWGNTGTPYWTAPEVLRRETAYTTQSDVYALGITLYEIYSRAFPYEDEDTETVLEQLRDPLIDKHPPFPASMSLVMQNMMKDCLAAQPHHRPTMNEIVARMGRLTSRDVEYQTENNQDPHAQFPANVERELSMGQTVIETQTHKNVSVVYCEIVGFGKLFSELPPDKFANLIQRVNDGLDEVADRHGVFKAEMMGGAAWLGATNCVQHQPDDHVTRIARFAIEAVETASSIPIIIDNKEDPSNVQIQVAFLSGDVNGDVVGVRSKRYSLSGPTVKAAQRLVREHCAPGRIVCCEAEQAVLERATDITTERKSTSSIPGAQLVFWVTAAEQDDKPDDEGEKPTTESATGQQDDNDKDEPDEQE